MSLSISHVAAAAVGGYSLYVLGRYLARRRPGDHIIPVVPSPFSMLVSSVWPPKGWFMNCWSHFEPFERHGSTVIPLIWPLTGQRYVYIGDAAALKICFGDRHTFVKDARQYELIQFFGGNIAGTEGDDWVRHRSVARKSFGERNNVLMWEETISTLNDWFAEWDNDIAASNSSSTIVNITNELRDITLLVIASAGFGMHFPRRDTAKPPPTYTVTLRQSLFTAIDTMVVKVIAPRFLYRLPIKVLAESDTAYTELRRYIRDMIEEARKGQHITGGEDNKEESADLFRRLIEANEEEQDGGQSKLSDDELVSNIYAFFLAGHETSSHTLTFALALLAIHPDIQEKVYQEAKGVWPVVGSEWNTSQLSDVNKLEYTLAVFRETLRLFPAVVRTGRWATADTYLPSQVRNNSTGIWQLSRVPVDKGTGCIINIGALHMSPLYWGEDVAQFKPERFIDTETYQWNRDAWIPFTSGPHVCLGQRFASIESVCILARTLRKYRVRPTDEVASLSFSEQWDKLTKWTVGVTATPGTVKLVLERRDDT